MIKLNLKQKLKGVMGFNSLASPHGGIEPGGDDEP